MRSSTLGSKVPLLAKRSCILPLGRQSQSIRAFLTGPNGVLEPVRGPDPGARQISVVSPMRPEPFPSLALTKLCGKTIGSLTS